LGSRLRGNDRPASDQALVLFVNIAICCVT
jgi:hypothetical protein